MATQKQTAVQQTVLGILGKYQKQIEAVVPKYMTPERMLGLVVGAFNNNPKLLQCQPMSVLNAVVAAASMGVEIRNRSAYLVPYKDQCQLLLDYRANMMLAERDPNIQFLPPALVYPQDEWEYWIEDAIPHFKHTPVLEGDRGERYDKQRREPPNIRLAYCGAYVGGKLRLEIMTLAQIEAIRKRSKAGRDDAPWITDYGQMARKTLVHRLFNYLPFDPAKEHGAAAVQSQEIEDTFETGKPLQPAFQVEAGDFVTLPSEPQRKTPDPPSEEEMKRTEKETLAREAGQNPKGPSTPQQGDLGTTR